MVTVWLAQQPPPPGPPGNSTAGWAFLFLAGLGYVLFTCIKAQIRPLNRCQDCPKPDADGNRRRCRKCGDKSEVLNRWAWVQMKAGIPVPRARRISKRHPRSVPEDW
jgi:hypothetical protein